MGQKVNPIGIRLGITRDWTSKWYASKKQFPLLVHTDFRVREFLKKRLADASVSRILIERAAKKVNITIQTARPGIVIGKKGEDIEKLRGETAKLLGMADSGESDRHSLALRLQLHAAFGRVFFVACRKASFARGVVGRSTRWGESANPNDCIQ